MRPLFLKKRLYKIYVSSFDITTIVFHINAYTGLLLDFAGFSSSICKIGLIECLALTGHTKLIINWIKLNGDLLNTRNTVKRNSYLTPIDDKVHCRKNF